MILYQSIYYILLTRERDLFLRIMWQSKLIFHRDDSVPNRLRTQIEGLLLRKYNNSKITDSTKAEISYDLSNVLGAAVIANEISAWDLNIANGAIHCSVQLSKTWKVKDLTIQIGGDNG